jgi:hypothetical protein
MYSNKKSGLIVGILFLFVFVSSIYGSSLVENLMYDDDFLNVSHSNKMSWMIGLLIHFLSGVGTVGIVIIMFPLLRQQSIYLAIAYMVFRSLEALMFVLTELHSLPILILSQQSVGAVPEVVENLNVTAFLYQEVRSFNYGIGLLFFCLGSFMFYYSMFKSEILPRWITAWGLVAIVMAFISSVLRLIGIEVSTIFSIILLVPIASNEIVMSIWLIRKGFRETKLENT